MWSLLKNRSWSCFKNSLGLSSRCYSKDADKLSKIEKTQSLFQVHSLKQLGVEIWDEHKAIKQVKKKNKLLKKINNATDFIKVLQDLKSIPLTFTNWYYYFKRKRVRKNIIEQTFLPKREALLKRDLAAAHFLIKRYGSVKFVGQTDWIGIKTSVTKLPVVYVPGLHIEAIDAEGTDLFFEGLPNISGLSNLKWLSLKGLNEVNDWFLDWISKEYYETLEYLDISECKSVTYRGLSCFYRFEQLKTLVVKGVPDTIEFKLACIMLQDVKPELDIQGIELSIPKKIDPINVEEIKNKNLS